MDKDVENQVKQEKNAMEPIIRVEHLCKTFDVRDNTVHAAKDISFDIERGDIFGIIGLSGAGKSTLVRCLNLLETADLRRGACRRQRT